MLDTMKTAIFDMDGTLLDSMPCWRALNVQFVRKRGIALTPEQERALFSLSGTRAVNYYRSEFGIETDFETLSREACVAMQPIYDAGVPLKPGAADYLRRLHARGVRLCVATATPYPLARLALTRAGIDSLFDWVFSTDMIGGYKGEPAFFDRLCARIGQANADCVMFEDSLYAIRGAKAAGLAAIAITDSTSAHDIDAIRASCDRLIDSYDELP